MTAERIAEVLYDSEAALRAIDREVVTLGVGDGPAPTRNSAGPSCAEPPVVPDLES